MNKSIFYFKQLTATEVGNKGTHEIYIRMPNDFDSNEFFQSELDNNNGVLEKRFKVKNLTKGHETDELVDLRFVYFEQSNKEKRIPSLGDLFRSNEVNENDVVKLESRIENEIPTFYITFLKPDEIQVNPKSFYYSVVNDSLNDGRERGKIDLTKEDLQQIYYGAPGTGKSHSVKCETEIWEKKGRVVRTTFHPDSDYSTFVGAYKPTTDYVERYDIYNKPIMKDGKPVMEQVITYEFVEQAFLQAYIDAWKNRNEPEYLVIEEINRGNCAQIFGDLFQLLDRGDDGYSDYAIRADKDLQKHLSKAFEDVEIEDYPNVKAGKELLLPGNLYIRATMNTSDQSLFPIDSAFKRRWDWKYVPIAKGNDSGVELNWMIKVGDDKYDWWTFVKTINKHVFDMTNSEDKQLGFFFCKAKDNIISAETFVGKVIFYLWNDVFKDFGFDDKIFADRADEKNPKLSFDKFYIANGKVNIEKIKLFLANLDMVPLFDSNDETSIFMDEDGNTKETVNKDFSKYSINGVGSLSKGKVVQQAVEIYANEHLDMDAEQIVDQWMGLKVNVPNFIESKATYDARVMRSKDSRVREKSKSVTLPNGDIVYVSNQYNPTRIEEFVSKVNAADWGIKIEKV